MITTLASLVLVWLVVRLLSRGNLAPTISTLIFFCMPAYRACLLHPSKRNLLLLAALGGLAVIVAFWYFVRIWGRDDKEDRFPAARKIAALGAGFLGIAMLSFSEVISVYISAGLAIMVGVTMGYWWRTRSSLLSKISFWLIAFVFAFSCVFEVCTADWQEGKMLDRMAEAVISEMGDRHWIVTNGILEEQLESVAKARGAEVNVVSLVRDDDVGYRKALAELIREKKLGGDACEELVLSLDLGVMQFVQDWFRADPEIARKCVVFGVPDFWYSADINPVPEVLFFGGDPSRKADWSRWPEFDKLLHAEKGWGSYRLWKVDNPWEQQRLDLRRHLGHVANDRGVWLQDAKRDEEAFALYRLVAEDIDRDNVSAMFNIMSMSEAKFAPAVALMPEIEERMKKIVSDKSRRYILGALSRFYGYIRNPDMFVRLGYRWARSGVPGNAMAQIRRAIDLVPSDRRMSLINMMASLYADSNDSVKSRRVYRAMLKSYPSNHEALMGMVRLSLMDGDLKTARVYLEKAVASVGDDPRFATERAMLAMLKGDMASAEEILHRRTDSDQGDVRALSLLASVLMQRCDAESDPGKKEAYEKELERVILPALSSCSGDAGGYYFNTIKAFVALRKGADHRREARDAFVLAAKSRPDIATAQDIVLGLDISLNDPVSAELHARDVLKVNRKAPLANYVMGSIAMSKNDLKTAEMYLKRAAEADRPVDLALNDLAELYRRSSRPEEAIACAEKAVSANPKLYVAKSTLASALMDVNRDLPRALALMNEAIELSKVDGRVEDFRMYISLARAQFLNGNVQEARTTLRKMKSQEGSLAGFEKREYEELLKSVK